MDPSPAGVRWGEGSRPSLRPKVRLQWDEPRGQAVLLYPEGILVLNPTAHAVLALCDGSRTLAEIVRELAGRFDGGLGAGAPGERDPRVAADVGAFLERLDQHGWIVDAGALTDAG
ncbi:MAG: pyrroloquinoline quinone biosynthesis peptide chaperone PqqD [Gemmatimonadota bacterium]